MPASQTYLIHFIVILFIDPEIIKKRIGKKIKKSYATAKQLLAPETGFYLSNQGLPPKMGLFIKKCTTRNCIHFLFFEVEM